MAHVKSSNPWFVNSTIKTNGGGKWRHYAGTQLCNYYKLNVIWYAHSARPTRMFRPAWAPLRNISQPAVNHVFTATFNWRSAVASLSLSLLMIYQIYEIYAGKQLLMLLPLLFLLLLEHALETHYDARLLLIVCISLWLCLFKMLNRNT